MTDYSVELAVLSDAQAAAVAASRGAYAQVGGDQYPCGFAWVEIRPGNSRIARAAKQALGARAGFGGGVHIWNPGQANVQNIDIKEIGARAFAAVLKAAGYNCTVGSRLD